MIGSDLPPGGRVIAMPFVLDQIRPTIVLEAPGEPVDQHQRTIGRSQQQRTAIRADRSIVWS